eukprot:gene25433-31896_t
MSGARKPPGTGRLRTGAPSSSTGHEAGQGFALNTATRTSTDPEDVQQMAVHMTEKNRQSGQDVDRIFTERKKRENETAQIEDQIEAHYRSIQKRMNELDPGRLRAFNDLTAKQREFQDRTMHSENRLNEINSRIRHYESDDKANALRKDYLSLEKQCQSLKKDLDSLQEDLDVASSSDQKAAKESFKSRAEEYKKGTKSLEEKASQLREDIQASKRNLEELNTVNEEDSGEAAKYELLVKRDQDMTAFMDSFDEARLSVIREQQGVQYMIVALLESIGKGLEDSNNMPSQEGRDEMDKARDFKERNLATAQKTMESLLQEKRKREREMEMLRSSEPNLMNELRTMRESMSRMRTDMEDFKDLDRIRREFDHTQGRLTDLKQVYIKRRDTMRQQIQSVSIENEALKKSLGANEVAREIEDTEKRLKHYERSIFELKEFVETKSRETDYDAVKATCLRLTESLNAIAIKKCGQFGSGSGGGAQAKGGW